MKWIIGVALLFLIACAQTPEPVYAPPTQVVMAGCEATQSIGERCASTCECLRPGECMNNICSLTKLDIGKPCVENKQCLSGYCTETKTCGGPDGPKTNYDCEKQCRDANYDGVEECYTVCKYR